MLIAVYQNVKANPINVMRKKKCIHSTAEKFFFFFLMLLPAAVDLYCIRLSVVTDMLYFTVEGWQHDILPFLMMRTRLYTCHLTFT